MKSEQLVLIQEDGYETTLYPSLTDQETVKGTVVILHGLAEHHTRYREFTIYLNSCGYDVCTYDHRGHGTDKMLEDLGFFADHRGWEKVINDAVDVLHYVSENKRGQYLILFGHSMGSLIARSASEFSDFADAAVFCGTTAPPAFTTLAGLAVSSLLCTFKGKRHRSPMLNHLLFEGKKYRRLCERTSNDWLSRSHTSNGLYMNDPYCGFICTASLYHDLIKLAQVASKPANIRRTPDDLPILLISGAEDPVSSYGDEVIHLFEEYKKYGYSQTECILYENCRHELLNELNRREIMVDITNFLDRVLFSASKQKDS